MRCIGKKLSKLLIRKRTLIEIFKFKSWVFLNLMKKLSRKLTMILVFLIVSRYLVRIHLIFLISKRLLFLILNQPIIIKFRVSQCLLLIQISWNKYSHLKYSNSNNKFSLKLFSNNRIKVIYKFSNNSNKIRKLIWNKVQISILHM